VITRSWFVRAGRIARASAASLAVLAVCSEAVFAGGEVSSAQVLELGVSRTYPNVAFVRLSAYPTGGPSCAPSAFYWQFTLTLDGLSGKELYAMLLSAQASGKAVRISGTGSCSEHGQIESLQAATVIQ
jgi:hypothetical protein